MTPTFFEVLDNHTIFFFILIGGMDIVMFLFIFKFYLIARHVDDEMDNIFAVDGQLRKFEIVNG
jgi:hypothetical protein